jgi:hypothetical protein
VSHGSQQEWQSECWRGHKERKEEGDSGGNLRQNEDALKIMYPELKRPSPGPSPVRVSSLQRGYLYCGLRPPDVIEVFRFLVLFLSGHNELLQPSGAMCSAFKCAAQNLLRSTSLQEMLSSASQTFPLSS